MDLCIAFVTFITGPGKTSKDLMLDIVAKSDSGEYTCTASIAEQQAVSRPAVLTVSDSKYSLSSVERAVKFSWKYYKIKIHEVVKNQPNKKIKENEH